MGLRRILAAAILVLTGLCSAAQAQPIAYVLTGQVYGSIGGTTLDGQTFLWVMTADTGSAASSPPLVTVPTTSQSLAIGGVFGNIMPLVPFQFVVDNVSGIAAFTDSSLTTGISFTDPAFVGYGAISQLGPMSVGLANTGAIVTDHGTLVMDDFSNLEFQAVFGVSNVAEPLTLTLLGAGIAGLGALRRRRKA